MSTAVPPRRLSRVATLALFVGLPLLALALIAVTAVLAVSFFRGSPLDRAFDVRAGSRVEVSVPNAAMRFGPSDDDRVHVSVTGSYFGAKPRVSVSTDDGVTTVQGGCVMRMFTRCTLRIAVTLPEALPLTVDGRNGGLAVARLTGPLTLRTTNGTIEARAVRGDLDLRSTNGGIRIQNSRSGTVVARTTNGGVDLAFLSAPDTVDARSTNGPITVRVPADGESYVVSADTTNGNVDTKTVRSERRADRVITAETTNGNVTVARAQE